MGRLVRIWVKRAHYGPMDAQDAGVLIEGSGLQGNANQGGRRQITLLEVERWAKVMTQLASDLSPSTRRANLLVEGIDLADSRGRILEIGPCRIRINGETRPCERMEQALPGLREALSAPWNGGAYGEITVGGPIAIGDEVKWAD
ncbi:MAG TPA: sulfurase [Acidobacteriota bacterium]|nr:sulfurase [Acidobacteriota bacterium]